MRTRYAAQNGKDEVALQGPCHGGRAPGAADVILPRALQSELIHHLHAHAQRLNTGILMSPALQHIELHAGGGLHAQHLNWQLPFSIVTATQMKGKVDLGAISYSDFERDVHGEQRLCVSDALTDLDKVRPVEPLQLLV